MRRLPTTFRLRAARTGKHLIPITALAVLIGWPPATGRLLLVPLSADSAGLLVRNAIGGGARIIDTGPLPGSIIVEGRRSDVAQALASRSVIIVAARASGCSPLAGSPARG
ncbi:hypothetical protein [Allosphingosinicella deserti]|uniref:Uncharacterized protein n=1 Tax=Allosphingosinicella deserti TaxID=2116704 RepID=A0A2P7QLX7_9SPHN|nr:hypothetical protein [Sphingomonas deserti]PSJ38967.1 hypothetical protein C7I55_16805 [Sphingomonas deserti]